MKLASFVRSPLLLLVLAPWLQLAGAAPGTPAAAPAATAAVPLRSPLEQELRAFRELTSVLYVAAHPDDENTHLITYLARGRGYRTAYLSLTRGDGGQNECGPDFGEKLGLARTHELLAARQLDGGRQFFSRALDFGYSKDLQETLHIWDRREVLADAVRVIRTFRPDLVIARFSPEPSRTHGHHTAATVIALEAFALAGDPAAFPEQFTPAGGGLSPWQPKRILHNNTAFRPRTAADGPPDPALLSLEAGGVDPVSGETFGAIAARSRAMHISQGFANFASRADATATRRLETFALLAGEPVPPGEPAGIFAGIESSWKRYPGGDAIATRADAVLASFDPAAPAASVPALLELRPLLAALPADPVVAAKREQLDHLLQACLGLTVSSTIPDAEVAPGEELKLTHSVQVLGPVPVKWLAVKFPSLGFEQAVGKAAAQDLRNGETKLQSTSPRLPAPTPPSQPYWLRTEGTHGLSHVAEPILIGRPLDPPVLPVEFVFEAGGQTLVVRDEPVELVPEAPPAQDRRPLAVIAPVTLAFASEVELLAPGAEKTIHVDLAAARAATGALSLSAPAGWSVRPASLPFTLAAGTHTRLAFTLTAPPETSAADLRAIATLGDGASYDQRRIVIRYPHLPVLLLQPAARLRAVSLEVATRGRNVGYLPGAGDATAAALAQLGYQVTVLAPADLTAEKLRTLDAVVLGVRAYEQAEIAPHLPGLFAYAAAGGTVVVQYNRPTSLKTATLAPYALSLAGSAPDLRVTDETAAVTFLAPEHPALTTPNRLGPADFAGWVQERGAYFASSWDEAHFTPLLAMNDPGEKPLSGGLLVARHGEGCFVYTSLAFFRQLPAGVPGAYRIFANLVSLGR